MQNLIPELKKSEIEDDLITISFTATNYSRIIIFYAQYMMKESDTPNRVYFCFASILVLF